MNPGQGGLLRGTGQGRPEVAYGAGFQMQPEERASSGDLRTQAFSREAVGQKVAVDIKVDPSLIGGLVVKVGSRMVDASLRSKLHRLQLAMKGVQ